MQSGGRDISAKRSDAAAKIRGIRNQGQVVIFWSLFKDVKKIKSAFLLRKNEKSLKNELFYISLKRFLSCYYLQ